MEAKLKKLQDNLKINIKNQKGQKGMGMEDSTINK